MSSISLEAIEVRLDALHEAVSGLVGLSFDGLTTRQRFQLLERLERETRRLPVPRHELVNGIRQEAIPAEIGGKVSHALADRLRISRAEAARWIHEAEDLGQRRALTGEPLQPRLAAVAAGQRAGTIGAAHVAVIRTFLHHLPCWVDEPTREQAEAHLAKLAAQFRPEQVAKLADKLADCLNPDGNFSDEDRARRRGLTLGKQDVDGMSPVRGWVTRPCGPASRPFWPAGPRLACATPMVSARRWSTARPRKKPSTPTPAARVNETTTRSLRCCAPCSPRDNWANTTDCRPASS
ncbi:hypothetical protein I552_9802 [Mycobacterium xenopi 3993]|nr:hypothetical protein I552_9802 [Mycobacterium xenopi 3993]